MSALSDAVKHIQLSADNESDRQWGDEAAAELERLKAEIEAEQKRGDMHADINRRAAEALGKPFSGDGSSWHDIPECIAQLKAEREALEDAKTISTHLLSDLKDYLREIMPPVDGFACEREIGLIDSIDAYLDLHGNSALAEKGTQ